MGNRKSGELDWQEYEELTKYIYGMLGAQYGIKVIGCGRDCKVKGKSGVKHQIDVLTQQIQGDRVLYTAIECKLLKKKVTKDTVMKLHSVMIDADIASGIIVCQMGFTKDTLTYADHLGIKLVDLRAAKDVGRVNEIINLGILDVDIKATITRPNIVMIDLGTIRITDEEELMAMRFGGYACILTPDGKRKPFDHYVNNYCLEVARESKLLKTITKDYPPIKGKFIRRYNNDQPNIEKISFTGFLYELDASSKRSFQLTDQVWMIMEEIFENKRYKVSKNGFLFGDNAEPRKG